MFPSSRSNGRILGWTKLVKKLVKVSGIKLTMHDTRRTCRTLMSRLEVPEDMAELAIGHQRADLVARYNFDQAWRRRVEAFERVSTHVTQIISETAGRLRTSRCGVEKVCLFLFTTGFGDFGSNLRYSSGSCEAGAPVKPDPCEC